ncbi:MAG: efflux RND transporter periplasmic adaptor subunit [Phascolarctobacterium sp.]|nr:efflux RND transporter periplasmic adaptor subunit [Phascolarctobacterium sp.]
MLNFVKNHKTALIVCAILIAGGFGGYKYYLSTQENKAVVKTGIVKEGKIVSSVSATGSLSAVDNVDISSKITGRIVEVKVVENQHVNAGDVLVRLDDTALRATMNQMKAKLEYSESMYKRYADLLNRGAVSQASFDDYYSNYQVAKTNYEKAVSDLGDAVIKTPIDGYIIGKPKEVGTTISSGISEPQVIMSVATLDKMQIDVLVDESDIGQVQVGQKVNFTVDAYPEEQFTGKVRLISRSATTSNNVIYYKVYVNVDDSKGKLLPTMTARTDIVTAESSNTMMVPLNCIWTEKGRKFVKVINRQTKETKDIDVQLGLSNDNEVQVTADGLKKGDVLLVKKAVAKQTNNTRRMGVRL